MLTNYLPCKHCGEMTNYRISTRISTREPFCGAGCANAYEKNTEIKIMQMRAKRDDSLDCSDTQCQPCWYFRYEPDEWHMRRKHQCPLCEGWRSFCESCFTDHHEGGWNSCNHDPKGLRKCPRWHPLCREALTK